MGQGFSFATWWDWLAYHKMRYYMCGEGFVKGISCAPNRSSTKARLQFIKWVDELGARTSYAKVPAGRIPQPML